MGSAGWGAMEYRKVVDGNSGFTGQLSLSTHVEEFNRTASAGRVRMRLGAEDFELEARRLKKLRGLMKAMTR